MITKAYFLFDSQYVRYDVASDAVETGYPKSIGANWTGFSAAGFASGIDAAVNDDSGKVYFFKGSQYLRYDIAANAVDAGFPKSIADHWPGLAQADFASGIDAAVNWGNGKLYFFKGDRYVRYDLGQNRSDDGYPVRTADGWPGFAAAGFGAAIDTALNWGNGKAYFFCGGRYLRYDIAGDCVDPGYPADIDASWGGLGAARAGGPLCASWSRADAAAGRNTGSTDFSYLSDTFFSQLKAVCGRLGCLPEDLLGVMESESSVQPWAQNANGKATGLIQFMPATLTGLGWTGGPDAFKQLSAEQQLPYVERFYHPYVGNLTSPGRLYQATFLPATLPGTDENSVIAGPQGPHADAYQWNTGLDTNRDGMITVSDLTARINLKRQGQRWAALVSRL
ncbi:Hemopexin [Caballeronia calidae]|uniref:Hemopexin n=2 Tax=Caballeronia calidae TaxID=1777139 RepID=A0A158EHA6_9BURK|nr:Hemopexin [Caballeronia calidae]